MQGAPARKPTLFILATDRACKPLLRYPPDGKLRGLAGVPGAGG